MDWGTALLSGGFAVTGAAVGGYATLLAASASFRQRTQEENVTLRTGLHRECSTNLRLADDAGIGLWSFEMRVMGETFVHPGAVSADEFERVRQIWVANEKLERRLGQLHLRENAPGIGQTEFQQLEKLREPVLAEVMALEAMLRPPLQPAREHLWPLWG